MTDIISVVICILGIFAVGLFALTLVIQADLYREQKRERDSKNRKENGSKV